MQHTARAPALRVGFALAAFVAAGQMKTIAKDTATATRPTAASTVTMTMTAADHGFETNFQVLQAVLIIGGDTTVNGMGMEAIPATTSAAELVPATLGYLDEAGGVPIVSGRASTSYLLRADTGSRRVPLCI